jgi:hypothetical protein
MRAVPEWRRVLKHAWSVRLLIVSGVLNALAAALMFGNALPIPPIALFILTFVVNAAALAARFVAQRRLQQAGGS